MVTGKLNVYLMFIQTGDFILSKRIYSVKITLVVSDNFITNLPLKGAFALF